LLAVAQHCGDEGGSSLLYLLFYPPKLTRMKIKPAKYNIDEVMRKVEDAGKGSN